MPNIVVIELFAPEHSRESLAHDYFSVVRQFGGGSRRVKIVGILDSRRENPLESRRFSLGRLTIQQWIAANGCPEKGSVIHLPQGIDDPTSVTRTTWGPGKSGSEVVLYTIEGGGHTWPGRIPFLKLLGPSTTAISANDVMWAFFTRHPMK